MTLALERVISLINVRLHGLFTLKADKNSDNGIAIQSTEIPWSWVALNVIKAVSEFPTGLTTTTLLAMLELKWESYILNQYKGFHCNFSTIQMVYDDRSSLSHALELHVIDWIQLANSQIHRVTLGENFSQLTLDMYLQPKYNMWINYQHDPRFMKGRSLRLISSAKTTSVVRNDGSDIPRHYTVATIPPSQLILIMLTAADKRFVQKEFTDRVRDVGYRNDYCLWLKITIVENTAHISPTPSLNPDDGPRLTRVDIHLVDMSAEGTPFVLSLYDKQTQLATMVQRHDYVGLYHPGVSTRMTNTQRNQSEIVFELMKDTAIFLMPEKEAREAKLNKVNLVSGITLVESFDSNGKQPIMERDEEGFMDCSLYKSRIYINDLEPCMINVTLLGKVVAVAENNPYIREEDDKRMDRYAMKIADSTGTIDITLWEDVGRLSRRQVKQGQYVILSGLHTSNRSRTNDGYVWYVNGSTVCNTEIYNVSSLHGLLTSVDFRSVMPLWYAKEVNLDSFQLEGTITGWQLHLKSSNGHFILSNDYYQLDSHSDSKQDFFDYSIGDRIIGNAHKECLHLIDSSNTCSFCTCNINNDVTPIFRQKTSKHMLEWQGWIEWVIDDGTSSCTVSGGEETILSLSATQFSLMSHQSQIELLESVMGTHILCSLSGNGSTYIFEQLIKYQPTLKECIKLLEVLDMK